MQRRFPLPEDKDNEKMDNTSTRSRFSTRDNPFRTNNRRDYEPRTINSRAEALKGDDESNNNPFKRQSRRYEPRNSRFDNRETGNFRQNNTSSRGGRFQRFGENRRYFRYNRDKSDSSLKKPVFTLNETDFPPLDGSKQNTKVPTTLAYKDAAKRGEKCPTPPPSAPLPPPERLSRPKKRDSDNESLGWDSDDEKAAREADPSDDEEEEMFWEGPNRANNN